MVCEQAFHRHCLLKKTLIHRDYEKTFSLNENTSKKYPLIKWESSLIIMLTIVVKMKYDGVDQMEERLKEIARISSNQQ